MPSSKPSITLNISGIQLVRQNRNNSVTQDAVVLIEVHGVWVELIREVVDGPFSHIIEPGGIQRAINFACGEQSYMDLAASGGIVEP